MMDTFFDKLMPFLNTFKNHPDLALGLVFFCLTMFVLLALLSLARGMRSRSKALPISSVREPIFAAAVNGHGGSQAMSNRSIDELLALEDSLKALRELYHRKLIPAEVYVRESKKYAESL